MASIRGSTSLPSKYKKKLYTIFNRSYIHFQFFTIRFLTKLGKLYAFLNNTRQKLASLEPLTSPPPPPPSLVTMKKWIPTKPTQPCQCRQFLRYWHPNCHVRERKNAHTKTKTKKRVYHIVLTRHKGRE